MREILFKAKREDNGEWVEGLLTIMWGQYHIINPSNENIAYPIDPDTICQYTGLTDKNGKKIWENDIVEISTEDENFKIEWQEDTASFVMRGKSFIVTFDNYWSCETEVIGNIFDNAELLGCE